MGFKLRWDLVVIFLAIYNSILTPQQFALTDTYNDLQFIKYTDVIVDIIFVLDILIMFRTNFRDDKRDIMISNSKLIAINYLKGRFVFDFVGSFPFEQIFKMFNYGSDEILNSAEANLFHSVKLTRLLRLGRMFSYIKFIDTNIKFSMKIA